MISEVLISGVQTFAPKGAAGGAGAAPHGAPPEAETRARPGDAFSTSFGSVRFPAGVGRKSGGTTRLTPLV